MIAERPASLYCPAGDCHVDPWDVVPRAVMSHADVEADLLVALSHGDADHPMLVELKKRN